MLTKNIIKQPKCIVEVSITSPWEDLEPKWNEVLNKLSADVELPGFRKGQAPLNLVEQSLGSKVQEEFLKTVMPALLVEALQGSNIVPIDYPRYQLISFVKGQSLSYKAQITERPEVKIADHKAINVVRPAEKIISDEDANKLVDDLFKRWKARQPMPTPADNQTAGSMTFGQPAATQAPVSDVPDDNFAKAVGATDLVDLKTKIKTDLEKEAKTNNELDFEELILQEVEKITTVDIPEILVTDEINRMLVGMQRRVADMGLLMEDYLKSQVDEKHPQGRTIEDLKTEWRAQAEKNVRMELGLAEIAKTEKVDVTDAELQAEIDKIQDAKMKAQFEAAEPRLHLKHSMRQIRTLDLLKNLIGTKPV